MPELPARVLGVEDHDTRTPSPVRRLDLYAALAATGLTCAVYLTALLTGTALPPGFVVVLLTAAPVCGAFALVLLWQRSRGGTDERLAWFTAGLSVAVAAMALNALALQELSPSGGPLRTGPQSWAALFLLSHLALALGAATGALGAPTRWRRPATAAGVLLALLVAGDVVPLPVLIRPDGTFTGLRLASEWVLGALMGGCAGAWVLRVGRTPPAMRGWIGVALSLATYDVVLNALAGARFTPLWWGSLSLRVATYAVLGFGLLWTVLHQLRDLESYSSSELGRRETQLKSALTQTRRLLRCAEDLASAVTPEEVATVLAADIAAMTGLPHVAVVVAHEGDRLKALGTAGYDGELAVWAHQVDWAAPLPAPRALLTGEPVFLPTQRDVRGQFPGLASTPLAAAQTLASLPLVVRGDPIAVVVAWDTAPLAWAPAARELLAGLTAQGGQALARALALEEAAGAATTLQASLLPSTLPQPADLALAVRYTPGVPGPGLGNQSSGGVGGDWYDCVEIDDHRVALVVGDVMGKGLHAAAVMGQMRTTLRALTAIDPSPRVVLAALDRVTRDLNDDMIATVAYVLLDTAAGSAQVGRAGHLPPLLVAPDGTVTALDAHGSPPLGTPTQTWAQGTIDVPPGSLLVLYSDGLVENRHTGLEPGLTDLTDAVSGLVRSGTDVNRLASAVMERLGGPDRDDDITLLLAKLVGAPVARDPGHRPDLSPRRGMDDLTPVYLRDGTEAFVVPLLPANREALREAYEQLSAETRFDRFLAGVPILTNSMLDHLVDAVDGTDHVALVLLVITAEGTELPVGLARIIRYPNDPTAADIAVTVTDDWHGRGVATALLGVLVRHRPQGVERIVTVLHATNRASLAMLRRLGEVEVREPESGVQLVLVDLRDSADSTPLERSHVERSIHAERDSPFRRHDPPAPPASRAPTHKR